MITGGHGRGGAVITGGHGRGGAMIAGSVGSSYWSVTGVTVGETTTHSVTQQEHQTRDGRSGHPQRHTIVTSDL